MHLSLAGGPRRNEIFEYLRRLDTMLNIKNAGMHTLTVFMVDPEVVLERIVINPNDQYLSYLRTIPTAHRN